MYTCVIISMLKGKERGRKSGMFVSKLCRCVTVTSHTRCDNNFEMTAHTSDMWNLYYVNVYARVCAI